MIIKYADRVREHCTVSSINDVMLFGAVDVHNGFLSTGAVTVSTDAGSQDYVTFCILEVSTTDSLPLMFEISRGRMLDDTTLERETVLASSDAGNKISFGNATIKEVFLVHSAYNIATTEAGSSLVTLANTGEETLSTNTSHTVDTTVYSSSYITLSAGGYLALTQPEYNGRMCDVFIQQNTGFGSAVMTLDASYTPHFVSAGGTHSDGDYLPATSGMGKVDLHQFKYLHSKWVYLGSIMDIQ